MANDAGLPITVLGREDMMERGMGAMLAVTQGSANEPRLIVMEYAGDPEHPENNVAIVGKGITFDSGGISIKPAASMWEMKGDMSGGASVIGAMKGIAALKPKINVFGVVPAVENMPSGTAQRPGDIIRAMNGKTIEVDNTDAEGRLILADAICYIKEVKQARRVVDIATLTGAVVVALGHVASGVMGTSQELVDSVLAASKSTGEKMWQLPLFEEYKRQNRSEYAGREEHGWPTRRQHHCSALHRRVHGWRGMGAPGHRGDVHVGACRRSRRQGRDGRPDPHARPARGRLGKVSSTMLTKLTIRNFKRFDEVEIELGNPVVFIGPNNSGKTSAMQALALWNTGLKRWVERRGTGTGTAARRPGVAVNRRDLVAIPVPEAKLLWRGLRVRDVSRNTDGKQTTASIRIDVIVEGITEDRLWTCGLEFDFANSESFYCRPLHLHGGNQMKVPQEAKGVNIAFLPPMSGLAANETRLDSGAVNVRVGEGRTAEVLRNLCYRIFSEQPEHWTSLTKQIDGLFGVQLDEPHYVDERGEVTMGYRERGVRLDLSSSGRGLQQTLLLLAYLYANPGAVLLLDEPDAHLEMLRQREIYQLITATAKERGSQIIVASHSEVLLNEAAEKDLLIAFVGRQPHRIDDRGSQVLKSLRDIGFEAYYQAEQTGWVLYLEGSTDLAILQAFAERLGHERASSALRRPLVHYVGNQPLKATGHYYGLREAVPSLKGLALFDRLDTPTDGGVLQMLMWERREIENYLCSQATLEAYAQASAEQDWPEPLFISSESERRLAAMRGAIAEIANAMETLSRGSPWSVDAKVSDEFLSPVFHNYYDNLGLPNLMNKSAFHTLVPHVPLDEIPTEISDKLDAIAEVAESARPA